MTARNIPLAIILAPIALGAALVAPALSGESPLRVVTISGQAEVQRTGVPAWIAATLRAELPPGGAARTLRGRLTLGTASGQSLRLAPASRLALAEAGAADQPTRTKLIGGSVWVAVLPASPRPEQIEVETGAVTCTVKGGGVGLSLERDVSGLVRVYHGAAECAGTSVDRRWTRTLTEGRELLVPSGGPPGESRALVMDKLEAAWVKWNEDQDRAGGYGGKTTPAR